MFLTIFLMSLWLVACALVFSILPAAFPLWLMAAVALGGALVVAIISRPRPKRLPIVVDGSNVIHWINDEPSLENLHDVIEELHYIGFRPIVWFDANVGYKVGMSYMGPRALARHLTIPASDIRVAPKGEPADPLLLAEAAKLNARVLSNDRFRDWVTQFPQLAEEDFLVRGRIRADGVDLKVAPPTAA